MANHASAKKRIRTNARRNEINTARTSRLRTFIKKVEAAIAGGDAKAANEAYKVAQPEMLRGVSKKSYFQKHGGPQTVPPLCPHQGAGEVVFHYLTNFYMALRGHIFCAFVLRVQLYVYWH